MIGVRLWFATMWEDALRWWGARPIEPPAPASGEWSIREIETLYRMAAAGKSYSEVAAMLPGRTRGAVAGKAQRLGVAFHSTRDHDPMLKREEMRRYWASLPDDERQARIERGAHEASRASVRARKLG